jgi:hypothetical protein
MKPFFYAQAQSLSDESLVYDVKVEWHLPKLSGYNTRFLDSELIHHALNADEACALVIALNEAVDSVLGK